MEVSNEFLTKHDSMTRGPFSLSAPLAIDPRHHSSSSSWQQLQTISMLFTTFVLPQLHFLDITPLSQTHSPIRLLTFTRSNCRLSFVRRHYFLRRLRLYSLVMCTWLHFSLTLTSCIPWDHAAIVQRPSGIFIHRSPISQRSRMEWKCVYARGANHFLRTQTI